MVTSSNQQEAHRCHGLVPLRHPPTYAPSGPRADRRKVRLAPTPAACRTRRTLTTPIMLVMVGGALTATSSRTRRAPCPGAGVPPCSALIVATVSRSAKDTGWTPSSISRGCARICPGASRVSLRVDSGGTMVTAISDSERRRTMAHGIGVRNAGPAWTAPITTESAAHTHTLMASMRRRRSAQRESGAYG